MSQRRSLRIADVPLTIEWPAAAGGVEVPPAYRPFTGDGQDGIVLRLEPASYPAPLGPRVFDTPPIWALHRAGSESAFRIYPGDHDRVRTLVIPDGGGVARLWVPAARPDPFFGPALELLMITHLAHGHGAVLHGCAVAIGKKGWLFVGESGAGKSTLSRLWAGRPGVEVLSDDRAIVRRQDGRLRLYGTPWHGEARFGAPGGVELDRLFFIRHGSSNALLAAPRGLAVREFLKCSFPPFWDAAGTGFTLEFFDALAVSVPCADFFFRPDRSAVDFVCEAAALSPSPRS